MFQTMCVCLGGMVRYSIALPSIHRFRLFCSYDDDDHHHHELIPACLFRFSLICHYIIFYYFADGSFFRGGKYHNHRTTEALTF